MGQTRVIFTDATTAEAASVLKSLGFVESSQGGLFTSPHMPIKAYVVWGRSAYFPDLLGRVSFTPRIQVHLKCREELPELIDLAVGLANGLRCNAPGTLVSAFNADRLEQIPC